MYRYKNERNEDLSKLIFKKTRKGCMSMVIHDMLTAFMNEPIGPSEYSVKSTRTKTYWTPGSQC